jgi:DNA-binding transcriptional ArsR family regulator
MVNQLALDHIFSALSDSTRRAILEQLTRGESSVTDLAQPFDMSLPAISKHLRILEETGLIVRRKEGRVHYIHLAAARMKEASEWLNYYRQFWEESLDSLGEYLVEESSEASVRHDHTIS